MDSENLEKKWVTSELTDNELVEFKKLEDFELNSKIIEGAKLFKASQFSTVKGFDELKSKLNQKQKETPVVKLKSYRALYRIAAMLVVALGLYFAFFNSPLTTEEALASQKVNFELPDASQVALNSNSKIEYNKKTWANKRELTLDGEAYFKVAKGSKFDVITTSGTVSVHGTQFNVNNRANYFEVKCFEGVVSVSKDGKEYMLTQGKTYRFVNGHEELNTTEDTAPKWVNNISSFSSVPLEVVIDEFERQYNVTITVTNVDTKRLFTGGFVHDNFEQALASITVPFNLDYNIDELNKITLTNRDPNQP